jgi:hypothetical protein
LASFFLLCVIHVSKQVFISQVNGKNNRMGKSIKIPKRMSEKYPSRRKPNERMGIPSIQAQRENGAYSYSPNLFRHPLTDCASPNGDNVCIITNHVGTRSVSTRLLASCSLDLLIIHSTLDVLRRNLSIRPTTF